MKKKYRIKLLIIAAIIALSAMTASIAFAADGASVVVPESVTENYIRFNNPTLFARSELLTAVLDGSEVRVFDSDNRELGAIAGGADGIAAANDSVYVELNHSLSRYRIEGGEIRPAEQITDKVISRLFADDGDVYFVDDANSVYRYDGTSITEIAVKKITFVIDCLLTADKGVLYSYKNGEMSAAGEGDWETIAAGEIDAHKFFVRDGAPVTLSVDRRTVAYRGKSIVSETSLDLYADGGRIFVLDNADKSIIECDEGLNKTDKIGSVGSEINRLSSPGAITAGGDKLFVADNGNGRISVYDAKSRDYMTVPVTHAVDKIAATVKGFAAYSAEAQRVFKYATAENGSYALSDEADAGRGVIDIAAWNDDVLTLGSDGSVIKLAANEELARLHGATDIYLNHKTNVLYVAAPTRLTRKNLLTGAEQSFVHGESFSDFTVDYGGNVYFMTDKSIRKLKPAGRTLTLTDEYALSVLSGEFSAVLTPLGDTYFSERSAHKLSRIRAEVIGAVSDKAYAPPEKDAFTLIKGAELAAGAGLYTTPGNEETLITISTPTRFLALAEITYGGKDYYYGYSYGDGEYYYTPASETTLLAANEFPSDYPRYNALLATGVNVYAFPYDGADIIAAVDFKTRLTLLDDVAKIEGGSWGWYKVSFAAEGAEVVGYVRDYEVAKVTAVTPPQRSQFYKVDSGSLGAVVKVYAEPSAEGDILFEINDGASVLVVNEFDKSQPFTYVYYNGAYGYVETQYLISEGLTTVQITAIIVISICAAALLVTCPLFFMLYKRSKSSRADAEK